MDSGKTDNLFNMTGTHPAYNPSSTPTAFVAHEDYDLIWRLIQTGPVTLKANLQNSFSDKPAPASITVAEIKGSELPDERVIVGGHLDSWDLGQGALDNGTGAMAVLEAARTLKSLGWKPKRTITFVLFTGEEQGGIGADTFVKNHAAELAKIDAVLIHDMGTGKVFSIALEDLWETAPLMSEIYRPLQEVFDLQPLSTRYFGSSDHVEFLEKGVPAYFCIQLPDHYREAHHSQTDTFDKVIPDQINEGAALLAAWAWNVSEMPQALPHHPREGNVGVELPSGCPGQLCPQLEQLDGFCHAALHAAESGVKDQLVLQALFTRDLERTAIFDGGGEGLDLRRVGAVIKHFLLLDDIEAAAQLDGHGMVDVQGIYRR